MAGFMDSVSTVNSLFRTLLALIALGIVGAASWFGYSTVNKQQLTENELKSAQAELRNVRNDLTETKEDLLEREAEIEKLNETVAEQLEKIDRLDTSLRLLKVNHRIARLTVVDQRRNGENEELVSTVEFVEFDDRGEQIDEPKRFDIAGDVVYVDSWIVKFDDKYVEQQDLDRSTSLVLFRRIFGEMQEPREGFPIDRAGSAPKIYARGDKMSEFDKQIWGDFWSVANDEVRQRELGIRAAHGDAPSIKVQKGRSYRIELRASDGLSITPEETPPQESRVGSRPGQAQRSPGNSAS